ncbi:MAG: MerR family transcriptional regulator [Bacteroidia bacterium]
MQNATDTDDEKLFYSIGEVANRYQVNTSLIRFWEKEFDVIKPRKNKKGNRLFTKADLRNFDLIFHLVKERGFTLEGARMKLKIQPESSENELEVVRKLEKIKGFLSELHKSL